MTAWRVPFALLMLVSTATRFFPPRQEPRKNSPRYATESRSAWPPPIASPARSRAPFTRPSPCLFTAPCRVGAANSKGDNGLGDPMDFARSPVLGRATVTTAPCHAARAFDVEPLNDPALFPDS